MDLKLELQSSSEFITEDIVKFILSVDDDFYPPLHKRVDSFEDYVAKVIRHGQILFAIEDDRILGMISFYCNDLNNLIAYISLLAVCSSARGKKISSKLISKCVEHVRGCGMKKIVVQSEVDNIVAEKMYKKNGFIVVDEYFCDVCGMKVIYEKSLI